VIVRQMLRRIQVEDPGDTRFIPGEQVERADVLEENEKVQAEGKKTGDLQLHAARHHQSVAIDDSFISADRSRRPPESSPKPRSWARRTTCAASRKT